MVCQSIGILYVSMHWVMRFGGRRNECPPPARQQGGHSASCRGTGVFPSKIPVISDLDACAANI